MTPREKLRQWAIAIGSAALAALLARYGIPPMPGIVPPAPVPPTQAPAPPVQVPTKPPEPQPDPLAAIGRIRTTVGGCSATIIGPRRPDGRYWVLSAAHCIGRVGERIDMRLRDGTTLSATVVAANARTDWTWCVTDTSATVYPYALLADRTPVAGTPIWHAGYGVDRPANREDGIILGPVGSDGRIPMRLSVSSGDSGGGIVIDANGRIVSCVCCTVSDGKTQWTEGASVESIRAGQIERVSLWEWMPIPLPAKELRPKGK